VRCCSPSLRPAAFPPPSPPPICGRLCSRLPWYYAAVRLLTSPATASPPRLPVVARPRRSGLGEARSPKFRRFPSIRNGVSDLGRAVAPCITVHNVLPSTVTTVSASARLSISRLNIPLRMIAVYASQPSSPATTQHSLGGGSLLPYPRRTSTGWTTPASPGALTCLIQRIAAIRKPQLYNALNPRIDPVSRPPCPLDRREFRYVRTVWPPKPAAVRLSRH
jgi:hypothetical protein